MKTKKAFEVEIEAKLRVFAFDAETARKKAQAALAARREVGPDVEATGHVWTYATTREEALRTGPEVATTG
jgi:hypothetical protein